MRDSFKVGTYVAGAVIIAISGIVVVASLPSRAQNAAASGAIVGGVSCAVICCIAWAWRRTQKLTTKWLPIVSNNARESANHVADITRRIAGKVAIAFHSVTMTSDAGKRYENLFKLKELLDAGIISAEEYEKERNRLLG